jgi:hypothetical protein
MAANGKVDNTTRRSPLWQPIEKLIKLPHDRQHGGRGNFITVCIDRHDDDRVVV